MGPEVPFHAGLVQDPEGIVLVHGDLLQDHALFRLEVGLVQGRTHHRGEQIDGPRQGFGQHVRVEARHFVAGEGVVAGSDLVEGLVELLRRHRLGALEHHVFEEVADSHVACGLVPGAGADEEAGCRGMGGGVDLGDDREAVVERGVSEGVRHWP